MDAICGEGIEKAYWQTLGGNLLPATPPSWVSVYRQGCSGDSDTQVGLLDPDETEQGRGKIDGGGAKTELAAHESNQEKR